MERVPRRVYEIHVQVCGLDRKAWNRYARRTGPRVVLKAALTPPWRAGRPGAVRKKILKVVEGNPNVVSAKHIVGNLVDNAPNDALLEILDEDTANMRQHIDGTVVNNAPTVTADMRHANIGLAEHARMTLGAEPLAPKMRDARLRP